MSDQKMQVYSGTYRQCDVGIETGYSDMKGRPLRTGDIVVVYSQGYNGPSLTVVVSDQYTSYSNGTYQENKRPHQCFVMGIRSVPLDDPGVWRVFRVKRYEDVIDGEQWRDYGFRFKLDDTGNSDALLAEVAKEQQ